MRRIGSTLVGRDGIGASGEDGVKTALGGIARRWVATHVERGCATRDQFDEFCAPLRDRLCDCGVRLGCQLHRCGLPPEQVACRACSGTRWVGHKRPCTLCNSRPEQLQLELFREECGITAAQWQTFDPALYDDEGGYRSAIESWASRGRQTRPFLVLRGRPGRGKTYGGIFAAHLLMMAGIEVSWTTVADLLDRLRFTQREGASRSITEEEARPRRIGALVLDDLLAGRQSPFTEERLLAIIGGRLDSGRLTVITTNIYPEPDDDRSRLLSRVFGERKSFVIDIEGRDRRDG